MNITIKKITEVTKLNKTELIMAVAEKANISKKDADTAVNAVIDTIVETLAKNDKVQLVGFGTFEVRSRKAKDRAVIPEPILLSRFLLPKFLLLKLVKPLRAPLTNKTVNFKSSGYLSRAFLFSR